MFNNYLLDGLFNTSKLKRSANDARLDDIDSLFKLSEKSNKLQQSELQPKKKYQTSNSLSTLKEEYNKFEDMIYRNEVLIEQLQEENKSAKECISKIEKKIKELKQDNDVVIKDLADNYIKKGGLAVYSTELLRLYNNIKSLKEVHIDIIKLEKGYDLMIELGKEVDATNIKLFKEIFKFMNSFLM